MIKIFLTEHKSLKLDTPRIIAADWGEAESKCPEGNRVIGELIGEVGEDKNLN